MFYIHSDVSWNVLIYLCNISVNILVIYFRKSTRRWCRFRINMSKFVDLEFDVRFLQNIATYFDILTFPYVVLLKMSFSCNILWHGMSKYWSSISSTLYNNRSVYLLERAHFLITNLYTGFYYAIYNECKLVHCLIFKSACHLLWNKSSIIFLVITNRTHKNLNDKKIL